MSEPTITREQFAELLGYRDDGEWPVQHSTFHDEQVAVEKLWPFAEPYADESRIVLLARLADAEHDLDETGAAYAEAFQTLGSLDQQLQAERERIKAMTDEVLKAREVNAITEQLEQKVRTLRDLLVSAREDLARAKASDEAESIDRLLDEL